MALKNSGIVRFFSLLDIFISWKIAISPIVTLKDTFQKRHIIIIFFVCVVRYKFWTKLCRRVNG